MRVLLKNYCCNVIFSYFWILHWLLVTLYSSWTHWQHNSPVSWPHWKSGWKERDRQRKSHIQYICRKYCLNVPNMGIGGGPMLLTISGSKSVSSITVLSYHTGKLFLLSHSNWSWGMIMAETESQIYGDNEYNRNSFPTIFSSSPEGNLIFHATYSRDSTFLNCYKFSIHKCHAIILAENM